MDKILLVEDEESLAIGLEYNLNEEGYKVAWAADGKKALTLFRRQQFDLIILDIMLPYMSGFDVAEVIRKKSPQIPILMLTAKTGVQDRVHGLEIGADDYLTKPFHLDELLARIKGMLKRKQWYQKLTDVQPEYHFGESIVNFSNLKCSTGKQEFQLTAREAMLLRYLIEHEDKIISREELLKNVWNLTPEVETRTVDNFVMRLRKYFEPNPGKPVYIRSVRSAGYMFSVSSSSGRSKS